MADTQIAKCPHSLDDLFENLPAIDYFDIKREELAAQLAALMVSGGLTRSELADKLKWKRSRVSRVLSGKENSTIKTIYLFASALGCDYDVVFRRANTASAKQMWSGGSPCQVEPTPPRSPVFSVVAQDAHEVMRDFHAGQAASLYFSFQAGNIGIGNVASISSEAAHNNQWYWIGAKNSEVIDV